MNELHELAKIAAARRHTGPATTRRPDSTLPLLLIECAVLAAGLLCYFWSRAG